MSFKDVLGHSRPIELLKRAMEKDKMAQSYLFLGNEGIGKKWVALQFAKAINCLEGRSEERDACDRCLSCRKIENGVHPDVLLIEPQGQVIKKEQITQMQSELVYRPYEGQYRVCILTAADRMAPHIPNALLKTLEEPPLHTLIILLANSRKFLLPTILSRCQPIRFNPLPVPLVSGWLMEQKGLAEKEARLLASLSEGSPGNALKIQEEIRQIPREQLLGGLLGLRSGSIGEMEIGSESLPSDREDLLFVLEVAKTLLRDLVFMKTVEDETKLIHFDLLDDIRNSATHWSLSSLLRRMEILHQTTLAIKANANTKLALEAMMLSWAEG